jgi:hypothetical protein
MLIEELGRLAHSHADQLCMGTASTTAAAAAAASTTRCEFFECLCTTGSSNNGLINFGRAYLEGRSAAQGRCRQTTTRTLLIDLTMRVLDSVLVDRMSMLVL